MATFLGLGVPPAINSVFNAPTGAVIDSRAQNGGTPEQAIATTWRDPTSYAAPVAPDPALRDRKRGGTNTF